MEPSSSMVDRALRMSIWEGVVWALMVGLGETYFIADAVRLGASPLELGLIVTLPLGAGRCRAARDAVSAASAEPPGHRHRRCVRTDDHAGGACGGGVVGNTGSEIAPRDRVPVYDGGARPPGRPGRRGTAISFRGRSAAATFARRNRAIYVATCLGLILGGVVLQRLEPASGRGGRAPRGAGSGSPSSSRSPSCVGPPRQRCCFDHRSRRSRASPIDTRRGRSSRAARDVAPSSSSRWRPHSTSRRISAHRTSARSCWRPSTSRTWST